MAEHSAQAGWATLHSNARAQFALRRRHAATTQPQQRATSRCPGNVLAAHLAARRVDVELNRIARRLGLEEEQLRQRQRQRRLGNSRAALTVAVATPMFVRTLAMCSLAAQRTGIVALSLVRGDTPAQ
eukprot:5525188-Pleurochrysis_carterae.AAC.2